MNWRDCRGFGLLEMFIGLMLASIILIALGHYTVLIKHQSMHINHLFAEDADLRRIRSMLRSSVWQAGYTPCLNVDRLISVDQRAAPVALHAINLDHDISINRMRPGFSEIISFDDPHTFTLQQRAGIMPDHAVIIADCVHAEVQSVVSINQSAGAVQVHVKNPLAFTYKPPVYVGEWFEEHYFVQKTTGHSGALFYNLQHVDRLTDLVHSLSAKIRHEPLGRVLQITFGLEQNRKLDMYTMLRAR